MYLPPAAVLVVKEDGALSPGNALAAACPWGRFAKDSRVGDDGDDEDEEEILHL